MPMKIREVKALPVHKSVMRQIRKNKIVQKLKLKHDDAAYISDIKTNYVEKILFKVIDKIGSSFANNTKIHSQLVKLAEGLLRMENKFSNNLK